MSYIPTDNRDDQTDDETCEGLGCWPFRRRKRGTPTSSSSSRSRGNRNAHNQLLVVPKDTFRHQPSQSCDKQHHRLPRFVNIRRESSPLLNACWRQDWDGVLQQQLLKTNEIYHRSHNTGRTALHFATMPGARCPLPVLLAILHANPFAVITEDYHQYGGTPLHFCCGSKLREQPVVVKELVDTALRITAEYPEVRGMIRLSFWSPLFQAAKWAAPAATLMILVQASRKEAWIAPWTGAEAWTNERRIRLVSLEPPRDSPLRALWRRQTPKRFISINGLPINDLRQVASELYSAADPLDFLLQDRSGCASSEVEHFCKLLVLLRTETPCLNQLLHTAAALHASIPPLVRLLAVLWPEYLLLPANDNGRLPLHIAVARYIAATTEFLRKEAADIVEILAQSQPQVLTISDPLSGLSPALLAASGGSVNMVYTLLRPVPTLIPVQSSTGV